jgi:hypothetical protein
VTKKKKKLGRRACDAGRETQGVSVLGGRRPRKPDDSLHSLWFSRRSVTPARARAGRLDYFPHIYTKVGVARPPRPRSGLLVQTMTGESTRARARALTLTYFSDPCRWSGPFFFSSPTTSRRPVQIIGQIFFFRVPRPAADPCR